MNTGIDTASLPLSPERVAPEWDRGVVGGIALAFFLILISVLTSGNVLQFLDIPSLLIVIGGTAAATMVNFSVYDIQRAWDACRMSFFLRSYHPVERIVYLVQVAQRARREGLLILEREAQQVDDNFLAKAFEITVDGQNSADARRILENEIVTALDRQRRGIQVLQAMASYAPAMGLIGTLIGLVRLLQALSDPAQVGPAMSVALLTTFYGALLANLILLPIAGKLRILSEEQLLVKNITIEGVMSIAAQENPIVMEQRLQSFLPSNADF